MQGHNEVGRRLLERALRIQKVIDLMVFESLTP